MKKIVDYENKTVTDMETNEVSEIGDLSDGYHTFNELYHHRAILTAKLFNVYNYLSWKSKKHNDGSMYEGMFIVGIRTPDGMATYHYDIDPYWDYFKIKEIDRAPKWDGHTPEEAIERINNLDKNILSLL